MTWLGDTRCGKGVASSECRLTRGVRVPDARAMHRAGCRSAITMAGFMHIRERVSVSFATHWKQKRTNLGL